MTQSEGRDDGSGEEKADKNLLEKFERFFEKSGSRRREEMAGPSQQSSVSVQRKDLSERYHVQSKPKGGVRERYQLLIFCQISLVRDWR